jgi:hypothetical protein
MTNHVTIVNPGFNLSGRGRLLNFVRRVFGNLSVSKSMISVVLVALVPLIFIAFLSLGNMNLAMAFFGGTLLAERFLYGEDSQFSISSLRTNRTSITLSDYRKRKFLALSAIEVKVSGGILNSSNSEEDEIRIRRATAILAEHVRSFSVELDSKARSIRYLTTGCAKTTAEACQKAETSAERILRIVRDLHGSNTRAEILEGEQLKNAFLSIVGGGFEVLSKRANVVLRSDERTVESSGFILLSATDRSIGMVDLRKIASMIRDSGIDVTYVISLEAHRNYDENVLIDGVEHGQMWVATSFFVINGGRIDIIREKAQILKSIIEGITRGGVLKIVRGSNTLDRVGEILVRSSIGKKLFLSNDQLISHIYTYPLDEESDSC